MEDLTERVFTHTRTIRELVPTPWDRHEFLAAVSRLRGRTITLTPVESTALRRLPCGLWVALDNCDEIVYDAASSEYQIDQAIMHEVGHMVLDHHVVGEPFSAIAELLPDIDLTALKFVMARSNFDDEQESEAELFADLVMASAVSPFRRSSVMTDFWGRQ